MFRSLLILIVAFVLSSSVAFAQLPTIKFGVDSRTLGSIDSFPNNVAEAVLKILKEGLPLLDRSVQDYLNRVDMLIAANIARGSEAVKCTVAGSVEIVQDQLSGSIGSLIFGGARPTPTPLQNLRSSIRNARDAFNTETEVSDVLIAYGDQFMRGAIVKCATSISPETQYEAIALLNVLSRPTLEWRLLIGEDRANPRCREVHACVVARRAFIEKYLSDSQKEDVASSGADEMFARSPRIPRKPWAIFGPEKIKIEDYEGVLFSLRQIEFAVLGAYLKRLAKATPSYDRAIAQLNESNGVSAFYEFSIRNSPRNPAGANGDAQAGASRAIGNAAEARRLMAEAAKLHELYAKLTPSFEASVAAAEKRAEALNAEAARNLAAIAEENARRATSMPRPTGPRF